MKHIFKKLHHQPNRSNETPQPPQSSPSEIRPNSSSSSSSPSPSNHTPDETNRQPQPLQQQQFHSQDYFASEEEYQVQLALALSVSSSGQGPSVIDSDKAPIRINGLQDNASADSLSRRYWNYGFLDFEERIIDGFYDIYNISDNSKVRGSMPSLRDIESANGISDYEVVIVNKNIDHALQEVMQIAQCVLLDCPTTNTAVLIQKLAELVTDHLGGPVRDANLMLVKWMEISTELRTSLHTSVLPIGSLKTGLSRHRALLFKALADSVGIPCKLVRGNHYTGIEDDAVNIIKLEAGSEFLVDLMAAPGTLIPADALGAQDTPVKSSNPRPNYLSTTQDSKVFLVEPGQNPLGGHNFYKGKAFWKPEAVLSSTYNSNDGAGTSRLNDTIPSPGKFNHNAASDGVRMNLNVTPYSQKRAEDPKNLFSDLNPFQIKGSIKTVPQNNVLATKADKLPFHQNSSASSRPPIPVMWKNQHSWDAVSWKNESDFGDDGYVKKNNGANNGRMSSVLSGSSAVQSKSSKLLESSFKNHGLEGDKTLLDDTYKSTTGEVEPDHFDVNKDFSISDKDQGVLHKDPYIRDSKNDIKQNTLNNLGTNIKLRESGGASCAHDKVIDDVGEREILWEDLVIGERIGLGSYGEVYRGDWNGTEVAVKKFLDQDFSGAALDEFKREVRIMRRLRHQNVVLFMGAVTRPPNLSIVTEFLPLGSLYRIIHRPHCQIDEQRRIKMALDVAKGMNCLHTSTPTIVHRDLKSPNLLVDNNWTVKVCDFGLSRLKHNTFLSSKSTAGTPEWMAPEVLRNEPSNEKCDVYSFGVILWELATLRLPWTEMNPMQVVGAVGFQNRRLDIPKELDPLVASIIRGCWQMEPNSRPSFAQLIVALKPLQRLVIPQHV